MRIIAPLFACLVASQALAQARFASFDMASKPILNDPHDLTIGPDGRLYVADKFNNRIAVLDADTLELIDSFGDGQLAGVHDISFGPDGLAYVAVTGASVVAVYDVTTSPAELINAIGRFPNTEGALAHSNGQLYVMVSGTGDLVAYRDEAIVASASGMFGAHDVAEALDGTIWVADNNQRRLMHFTPELELIRSLDDPKYGFIGPRYLDIDDFGRLVVADQDAHRILLIDPVTGDLLGVLGDGSPGIGPGKFDDPEGIAVYGNSYYIADSDNNRVVRYVVVIN